MPDKPKLAFYWCASCGGCEESVVDLAEDILLVVDAVDIVLWPVAMDFKRKDVEAMPDGSIAATFLNGAIRTSEQEEMARLLRRKSRLLFAYGSCAHLGGIPGLANQFPLEEILRYVYEEAPSTENREKVRPAISSGSNGAILTLPAMRHLVRTLDQVVEVDYTIPGCPPPTRLLKEAVMALLGGSLPPQGSVLAPDIALCTDCPRKESKPEDLRFEGFKRRHLSPADPDLCLLAQGFLCMGPATRSGCDSACIGGNMPCTGCLGPTSRVADQGLKYLSSISSNIDATESADIERILSGIPDPIGTFYRYGLARSILRRKIDLPA